SQPASSFAVELMRGGPGFNANEALIHKYDPNVGFLNAFFTIPNATRDEIKGMVSWETFGASGEKIPYLVVALKDHVFLINYNDKASIEKRINFENDMEVAQIFQVASDVYVFLTHNASTRAADQIYPLYRIHQLYDYTARSYNGQDVEALCVPRSHELQDLAN